MRVQRSEHFVGAKSEYLSVISEEKINDILNIFNITTDEVSSLSMEKSKKDELWFELASIIRSFSEVETSPSKLDVYVKRLQGDLEKAKSSLQRLEYEAFLNKNADVMQYSVSKELRNKSRKLLKGENRLVSDLLIIQEHERDKEWGVYCPFDEKLSDAIQALNSISLCVDSVADDLNLKIEPKGKNKGAPLNRNMFLYQLCVFYKKYTGKEAIAWGTGTSSINSNTFYGDILSFLQVVLPCVNYKGRLSDSALQKKIRDIRHDAKTHGKYQDIWQDKKN